VKLLLDTHALLWWLSDDPRLGAAARDRIMDPANDILISVISLWEILVKVRAGKLDARIEEILEEMQAQGFALLQIAPTHLMALAALPMHHRDSFDHLLIAQAIADKATFLSDDGYTPRYPVSCLSCSGTPSGLAPP
jgi:PIN domain nuclease of toxin-antitoxin system